MSAEVIAFFGATGDCAGHCLARTLNAGYTCIALARTPEKLTKSMQDKGVSAEILDNNLVIVQGDVTDVEVVKKALQVNRKVVDKIVSGIGGRPKIQMSIIRPVTLTDPEICQTAGKMMLEALQQLKPAVKPMLINVSTTGIPSKGMPRDVPLALLPLYKYGLSVPHEDKAEMEKNLAEHVKLPEGERGIKGFVNVKPSLLVDGEGKGLQAVKEGVDDKPAIGYTISRKDVGLWIFEKLVKGDVKDIWVNKGVTITY